MTEKEPEKELMNFAEYVAMVDSDISKLMKEYELDDDPELSAGLHRNSIRLASIAKLDEFGKDEILDFYRTCEKEDLIAVREYLLEDLERPDLGDDRAKVCRTLVSLIDEAIHD